MHWISWIRACPLKDFLHFWIRRASWRGGGWVLVPFQKLPFVPTCFPYLLPFKKISLPCFRPIICKFLFIQVGVLWHTRCCEQNTVCLFVWCKFCLPNSYLWSTTGVSAWPTSLSFVYMICLNAPNISEFLLFADGTNKCFFIILNILNLETNLNVKLEQVRQLFYANKLPLNIKKTTVLWCSILPQRITHMQV